MDISSHNPSKKQLRDGLSKEPFSYTNKKEELTGPDPSAKRKAPVL
jgi:hypothetical protein